MNPLDKLFQQKLEPLAVPPSPDAWNRIEANLAKKNNGIIWFRWAAGIGILLSLTGIGWYLNTRLVADEFVATRPAVVAPVETPAILESADQPRAMATTEQPGTTVERIARKRKTRPNLESAAEPVVEITAVATLAQPVAETIELPAEVVISPETAVVIEYTLPTVAPVDVESTEAEPTGFEKIKIAALELKHSEGWWGNLRMAKDDLLALDFKKDKNKRLE